MNYDKLMQEQMQNIKEGTKILLHACCAPCSSACLERIANHFQVVIYYYNPNITKQEEYEKRLAELKRFVSIYKTKFPIEVIPGEYEPLEFYKVSKGLEKEKERGKRCYECYKLRLKSTAEVASSLNIPFFATTLSLSPHKNVDWINEIGSNLNDQYQATYLYSDFKKQNGYKRSIELSKEYNLYRQDYCGCIYSKIERDNRQSIVK